VRASFAPTHVLALARLATDQSTDCALDGATGYPLPAFPPSAVIDDTPSRSFEGMPQGRTDGNSPSRPLSLGLASLLRRRQATTDDDHQENLPAHRKTPFGGHIERLIGS
jgi:hypothetical protein